MKFTFMGFSQAKALELGLDDKDLAILRYFIDFKDSGAMAIKIINDKPYYWLKYESLLSELPILGIKSKIALRRRLKTLVDSGVLDFELVKEGGTFSFYGVGEKYKELIASDTQKEATEKFNPLTEKFNPLNSKVKPPLTEKFNQKINLLKDPSIKDIYSRVIEYLNLKANTKYKFTTKKTQSLIKARLDEGFTEEDFKKVIDKKVNGWINDSVMNKYLRPETLFGTKFEAYLNEKDGVTNDNNGNRNSFTRPNTCTKGNSTGSNFKPAETYELTEEDRKRAEEFE
ncbi:conserved phage C-terminal domain-containing protein [Eubacterium multiforme]|uniref:Phage protein (TIGR02220 family) n=1 Tax=Eubacterium multiforme TaxID=83339 RepID=A0ABT9US59_9FIRM|nr:conserved phage C-terminal domain-containing protein [Eubacterium multiforme]MDQ0149149.1 putative phage protein (TIGR02220 family) [Eubacterium multiforme]